MIKKHIGDEHHFCSEAHTQPGIGAESPQRRASRHEDLQRIARPEARGGCKMKLSRVLKIVFMAALWYCPHVSAAQPQISVEQFGAKANSFEDAMPALKKAIAACAGKEQVIVTFNSGRYDFWPHEAFEQEFYTSNTTKKEDVPNKVKTIALLLQDAANVTIEGNGAEFIFHGKMTPWALVRCRNIVMRNFTIDFERPSMSELTLKQVSATQVVADVHPDSKFTIIDDRLIWYGEGWRLNRYHAILTNAATGVNTYSSWMPFARSKAGVVNDRTVTFTGDFSQFNGKPDETLTVRDGIRDQVGGFINHSSGITLSNITIRYMHGFGILGQFAENLSFDKITVAPHPAKGRTMSSFADAFHFSSCRGQIKITNSVFKGLHDDPINVHGTHLKVTAIMPGNKLRIMFMHPETYGFDAFFTGDTVAFVHAAKLKTYGTATLKSAKLVLETEMEVELTAAPPPQLAVGHCLENLSWYPSLVVRNCRFESVNTRGLLVTTRKPVLIEKNTFYRTGMHAILIADDASSWYESGPVENVIIRQNTFVECGYNSAPGNFAIAIVPETHELETGYFVHRNIAIEDNEFVVYDSPLLIARSVQGITFSKNTIRQTDFRPHQANAAAIDLNNCDKVVINGNTFKTVWKPTVRIDNMKPRAIKTDVPLSTQK